MPTRKTERGPARELERIEKTLQELASRAGEIPSAVDRVTINPTVTLLDLSSKGLIARVQDPGSPGHPGPESGGETSILWFDYRQKKPRIKSIEPEDLLALKMVAENIRPEDAAATCRARVDVMDGILHRGIDLGLLLAPHAEMRRDPEVFGGRGPAFDQYQEAAVFTLQWHITNVCDLHCRHCYDRSRRTAPTLDQALFVLDELRSFLVAMRVPGQVTFTGGNPLLYPYFFDVYKGAAERGMMTAILGNPTSRAVIEHIISIQPLEYYQVSLEGLPEHNDHIRGPGHFERVMVFLDTLRELGVYSMVMLTLTNDNMDQVIPLAKILRDRVDSFTFNRLSPVGEGARLKLPSPDSYADFLEKYVDASRENPVIAFKDNLINIVLEKGGCEPFGGCAGFGCGAAFNFLALLPDGELHACRKFPSPIGNIRKEDLYSIYFSELAERYRRGPEACAKCAIRPVCGGCLAVSSGLGLDIFRDRDPFCFRR